MKQKLNLNRKRAFAAVLFVLAVMLIMLVLSLTNRIGGHTSVSLPLSTWKTFRRETRDKYSGIKKLEARQYYPCLRVNCYYGKITPEEKENLKTELKAFLSSEGFLTEYLPYARENCVSPDSFSVPEHMPNIFVRLIFKGAQASEWMSEATYYKRYYNSDQSDLIVEIDNYQTWSDFH